MDLSIIIPCYNLENYIFPMLMSLRLQNLYSHEVELIFVCDSCTDNTKQQILNFDFNNSYTVHILEVNVNSCGLARNEGMKIAKGKYIGFVDGDDGIIDFNAIDYLIKGIQLIDKPILQFDYNFPQTFEHYGYFSMVGQYIYEKDFIKDISFSAIQPEEDVYFQIEVFNKIAKNHKDDNTIPFFNKKLYYYNFFRPGSNMGWGIIDHQDQIFKEK